LACRNAAALFNMSSCGKFYLTGPEAQRVAELAFTADLTKGDDRYHHKIFTLIVMFSVNKWCENITISAYIYIHSAHALSPSRGISDIPRESHVFPKLLSYEEYYRRDRW
jgi:hypothetical protein